MIALDYDANRGAWLVGLLLSLILLLIQVALIYPFWSKPVVDYEMVYAQIGFSVVVGLFVHFVYGWQDYRYVPENKFSKETYKREGLAPRWGLCALFSRVLFGGGLVNLVCLYDYISKRIFLLSSCPNVGGMWPVAGL